MRRLASRQDLHAVYTIYMDEEVVRFLGYDPMPLEQFAAIFEEMIASKAFFVYLNDGEVAGFYRITRFAGRTSHVAQLGSLAVAPAFHGQGVARSMLTEAIAEMHAAGIRRVELIVESDNPRGMAFYQRAGFCVEGTLRQFYKRSGESEYIDDYIMAKLLP